jgi:hypothetical protein
MLGYAIMYATMQSFSLNNVLKTYPTFWNFNLHEKVIYFFVNPWLCLADAPDDVDDGSVPMGGLYSGLPGEETIYVLHVQYIRDMYTKVECIKSQRKTAP